MEEWQAFSWLTRASVLMVSLGVLMSLLIAFAAGYLLRTRAVGPGRVTSLEGSQEGLVVSAVLVVLGLLLGFTFSLALDRFEERRQLVVAEANAIGTSYLRAQLLDEPDRTRLSRLLIAYTDTQIELATRQNDNQRLVQKNNQLLTRIWAAVVSAMNTPKGKAIATPLLLSFNELIDRDTERQAARAARIPGLVMVMLYVFLVVIAAVLGFVLVGVNQRIMALIMCVLLTFGISIITDLNRPTTGTILESQQPMLQTKRMLEEPRSVFEEYESPIAAVTTTHT
jgi:hypothetical protein